MLPRYKFPISASSQGGRPSDPPDDMLQRAVAFHRLGRVTQAVALYLAVLKTEPNNADALHLLGVVALQQEDPIKAATLIDKAIELKPDNAAFYVNYGSALQSLRRLEAAVASFTKSLSLQPDVGEVYFNRANAFRWLKQFDAAAADYARAATLLPGDAEIYWSQANTLLLAGDFINGLPLYEWRFKRPQAALARHFVQPRWTGEPLAGKTIFIWAEQGLGDTIQFCRYVSLVAGLGGKVILEAPAELLDLFRCLDGVSQLVVRGAPLPAFDCHFPLMSLPLAFGTTPASMPSTEHYLASTPEKRALWAARLGPKTALRVGIVWSSTSGFEYDADRSVTLAHLLTALPAQGCEFICLQKTIKDNDRATLATRPDIRFFGDDLHDFSETAALVDNVDLVVSTCTSVPHLSGALGKKTLILLSHLPDWRWLAESDSTGWYPAVSLYRQAAYADWGSVFARVRQDLERESAGHAAGFR